MHLAQKSRHGLSGFDKVTSSQTKQTDKGVFGMKNGKIIKAAAITLGVTAFLGLAGSFAFGGFIADKILHQNDGKDTHQTGASSLYTAQAETGYAPILWLKAI